MELEELKNIWQSVKPNIDSHINNDDANKIIVKKNDIKTRILIRAIWEGIATTICLILMATSPVWAPIKFPYWWLSIFCLTVFIANIYGIRIYRLIKAINLSKDTNQEILMSIISIKKTYRNIELATAAVIIPLLIWFSLTPLFINSWRMFFTWGLTIVGFTLEYLWYRSNIKQFNNLTNWEKE
ncbi:MAG: hypothetical protein K2M27_09495 [Muribaculaceae bacterium]|nr:hypothetical protein [Muribaculaceae bacterium]